MLALCSLFLAKTCFIFPLIIATLEHFNFNNTGFPSNSHSFFQHSSTPTWYIKVLIILIITNVAIFTWGHALDYMINIKRKLLVCNLSRIYTSTCKHSALSLVHCYLCFESLRAPTQCMHLQVLITKRKNESIRSCQ